jgi:hypothetical protein
MNVSDEGCFRNVSCALRNIILGLYFLDCIFYDCHQEDLIEIEISLLTKSGPQEGIYKLSNNVVLAMTMPI